ncbi:MAG: hypothetical protein MI724_17545 [Spirochaetales bacterium]|nr:hypothetical protein [Spirochaetales bacterium]
MRCAIVLAGRVVPACSVPVFRVQGAELRDLDGLADDPLYQDIIRAMEKIGVTRCTEVLPGVVLSAYQLLSETETPTDEQIHEYSRHLAGRCLSRDEFERAVRLASRVQERKRREQQRR